MWGKSSIYRACGGEVPRALGMPSGPTSEGYHPLGLVSFEERPLSACTLHSSCFQTRSEILPPVGRGECMDEVLPSFLRDQLLFPPLRSMFSSQH